MSALKDTDVSRVSLKNRNPGNTPNEWQTFVLQDFDVRAAAGESIDAMASVLFVEHAGGQQMRFMKAVPTGGASLVGSRLK